MIFSIESFNKFGVSSEAISFIFSQSKKKNCDTHFGIFTSISSLHKFSSIFRSRLFFRALKSDCIIVGFILVSSLL